MPEKVVRYNGIEKDPLGAYILYHDYQTMKFQLVKALEGALEHENHEEGKCGCGWTLKAETVLKSIGEEV